MKAETSVFCETYGNTIRNRVLEQFLEGPSTHYAVSDIAKEARISRPKAYEFVKELEGKGIVMKSRIVSHTQLYKTNQENPMAKLLIQSFNTCLRLAMDEYIRKHPDSSSHVKYASKPSAAYVKEK